MINKYFQAPRGVRERAAHSLLSPAATVGQWHVRRRYWPLQESPGLPGVGAQPREGPQGLQSPASSSLTPTFVLLWSTPLHSSPPLAGEALGERRCFRTRASRFLDTFLSLGWPRQVSAPAWASSPTPGHLGSMARGRVPGPVEEVAACAETTRAGAGNTMSLGPHKSPDMRVRSGDWQRSSRWCPRRHHCPPGSGAAEPSTPD